MITLTKVVHTRAATTGDKWPAFARQGVLMLIYVVIVLRPVWYCLILFGVVF
jgi:hypothetical protein